MNAVTDVKQQDKIRSKISNTYHPTSESTPALQSPLCGKAHVNTHFASVSWIPGPSLLEASLSGAMEAPWQVPDEQKTHINQFMF